MGIFFNFDDEDFEYPTETRHGVKIINPVPEDATLEDIIAFAEGNDIDPALKEKLKDTSTLRYVEPLFYSFTLWWNKEKEK